MKKILATVMTYEQRIVIKRIFNNNFGVQIVVKESFNDDFLSKTVAKYHLFIFYFFLTLIKKKQHII
jgi:hypothetical protein